MLLSQLKLTASIKRAHMTPTQIRRNKLIKRIDEQIGLTTAEQTGAAFVATKKRTYIDPETGLRQSAQVPKSVKAWYFVADSGKLCLYIKYGARVLELAKGKFAVEVGTMKELVRTLELIRQAVEAGEFDALIDTASKDLRKGFTGD